MLLITIICFCASCVVQPYFNFRCATLDDLRDESIHICVWGVLFIGIFPLLLYTNSSIVKDPNSQVVGEAGRVNLSHAL